MAAVKSAIAQDLVQCPLRCLHSGLFNLPPCDYKSYLSYSVLQMKAIGEVMETQLKQAKDDFKSRGETQLHDKVPFTKESNVIEEWTRLWATSSIDARRRLWTPETKISYKSESKIY